MSRMQRMGGASLLMLWALSAHAGGFGDYFGGFAGRFDTYGTGRDGQEKLMDAVLVRVSAYMNKRMPEVVDHDTRLDRVSAEPGSHFSYHYTLMDSNGATADRAKFARTIRPAMKSRLCENSQVRSFLAHGITVAYVFKSKDGAPVGGAEFAPASCDGVAKQASVGPG
jgi:hypothetical protein